MRHFPRSRHFLLLAILLSILAMLVASPAASTIAPSVVVSPQSSVARSAWDAPQLSTPQTIEITDSTRNLKLDQATDYILKCDATGTLTWGLVVFGGHNVTLQDCDYNQGAAVSGAAQFKDQTGTLYLHGVHFQGTALEEGIDLQEPGTTTVVLRDVLIDQLFGSQATNHADCIQAWSGPQRLLVDGFTCTSQYQGFFLLPNQQDTTTQESVFDLRHVDLTADPPGGNGHYLGYSGWFGRSAGSIDFSLSDFYENGPGEPANFPDRSNNCGGTCGLQWADVLPGLPSVGHYVVPTSFGASGPDEPGGGATDGAGIDPVPLAGEGQ